MWIFLLNVLHSLSKAERVNNSFPPQLYTLYMLRYCSSNLLSGNVLALIQYFIQEAISLELIVHLACL